jgi:prepilin-type processing-associated H-X9-DG protein
MTPAYFHIYPTGVSAINGRSVESVPSGDAISQAPGFSPRIDLIGTQASSKAFVFEGARYYDPAISGFDYSTVTNTTGLTGTPQGNFNSRGSAFMGSGEGYIRDATRGYKPSDTLKKSSLRHDLKMNTGMFDGHVESLNNVRSADPTYYTPTRAILKTPSQTWWFILGPSTSPLKQGNAVIP